MNTNVKQNTRFKMFNILNISQQKHSNTIVDKIHMDSNEKNHG